MLTLMLEYFLFSLLTTHHKTRWFSDTKPLWVFGLEAKLEFLGCILASGSVFGCIMHLWNMDGYKDNVRSEYKS